MDPSSPTLILDHVSKSFGDFKAVSDLSVQVRPGRVFGLIGPNGAGKTTTIRMIVNITAPDTGTIKLFGKSMTTALRSHWLSAGRARAVSQDEGRRAASLLCGVEGPAGPGSGQAHRCVAKEARLDWLEGQAREGSFEGHAAENSIHRFGDS